MKVVLDTGAYMPKYAHEQDAGADLRSPFACIVPKHSSATIDTGVHIDIPNGFVGMLKSKSGLNVKHGITSEGVIDAGYQGSIVVKLYNNSDEDYVVSRGDKISQIVFVPFFHTDFEVVDQFDQETDRGNGGFGSTGK